jgi:hypothetical protein
VGDGNQQDAGEESDDERGGPADPLGEPERDDRRPRIGLRSSTFISVRGKPTRMAAKEASGGLEVTVSGFVLKVTVVAVGLIVLGFLAAQFLAETSFTGVVVGMLYSTGGLMLAVILVGVLGDLLAQLRRRR